MSQATLNVRIVQPRLLALGDAARYCGQPASRFHADCPVVPIAFPNGRRFYDVRDLDRWIDSLKSGPTFASDLSDLLS